MVEKVTRLPVRSKDHDSAIKLKVYEPGNCQHIGVTYYYSDAEKNITCGGCGAQLNPIWVVGQFARAESRWNEARRRYKETMQELDRRIRCKCQHCGKMTRIRGL